MPTIIDLNLDKKKKVLSLLNSVKDGYLLQESELLILKNSINNSLVGLSKLLHFINPQSYAIWDSRIFRYLTEKKSNYGIDQPKNYLEYLKGMDKISKNPNYDKLHKLIINKLPYEVSPMRAIEITMFEADRKSRNIKNNDGNSKRNFWEKHK